MLEVVPVYVTSFLKIAKIVFSVSEISPHSMCSSFSIQRKLLKGYLSFFLQYWQNTCNTQLGEDTNELELIAKANNSKNSTCSVAMFLCTIQGTANIMSLCFTVFPWRGFIKPCWRILHHGKGMSFPSILLFSFLLSSPLKKTKDGLLEWVLSLSKHIAYLKQIKITLFFDHKNPVIKKVVSWYMYIVK